MTNLFHAKPRGISCREREFPPKIVFPGDFSGTTWNGKQLWGSLDQRPPPRLLYFLELHGRKRAPFRLPPRQLPIARLQNNSWALLGERRKPWQAHQTFSRFNPVQEKCNPNQRLGLFPYWKKAGVCKFYCDCWPWGLRNGNVFGSNEIFITGPRSLWKHSSPIRIIKWIMVQSGDPEEDRPRLFAHPRKGTHKGPEKGLIQLTNIVCFGPNYTRTQFLLFIFQLQTWKTSLGTHNFVLNWILAYDIVISSILCHEWMRQTRAAWVLVEVKHPVSTHTWMHKSSDCDKRIEMNSILKHLIHIKRLEQVKMNESGLHIFRCRLLIGTKQKHHVQWKPVSVVTKVDSGRWQPNDFIELSLRVEYRIFCICELWLQNEGVDKSNFNPPVNVIRWMKSDDENSNILRFFAHSLALFFACSHQEEPKS